MGRDANDTRTRTFLNPCMRTPVGLKSNPQTRPFVTPPRHAASAPISAEQVATTADMAIQPRHAVSTLRLTVLIAAHNEEQSIGSTLDSVLAQERLADRIGVEADNCTDGTR